MVHECEWRRLLGSVARWGQCNVKTVSDKTRLDTSRRWNPDSKQQPEAPPTFTIGISYNLFLWFYPVVLEDKGAFLLGTKVYWHCSHRNSFWCRVRQPLILARKEHVILAKQKATSGRTKVRKWVVLQAAKLNIPGINQTADEQTVKCVGKYRQKWMLSLGHEEVYFDTILLNDFSCTQLITWTDVRTDHARNHMRGRTDNKIVFRTA